MQARTILAICGPSNAGKSQLARAVADMMGSEVASRVPTDYFFVPRLDDEPFADFLQRPLAYDWPLLAGCLTGPDGTERTTPDAEFKEFTRRSHEGGRPFTLRPVIIVDAMRPYPVADILVRVDAPDDVRRERIAERDRRWGTRVGSNWSHLETTWARAAAEMRSPDQTLDGTRALDVNAAAIGRLLERHSRAK